MRPEEFVICSDFDDTINDLLQSWVTWLNMKYGTSTKYEDIHEWDLQQAFPTLTMDQICDPLHDRAFWQQVDVKPDAVEYVNKLIAEGFNFYIATASSFNTIQVKTEECLFKFFPAFDSKHIIAIYDKQLLNCHVIIDDNPLNLKGSRAVKILFDAPHNQNSGHVEDFRVTSWEEIYDIIHELMNVS